ncbi:MAG: hypothetical protein HY360_16980 [Verrucomicrobia bacterium]|nr:hypothetical protein [Verrucomicrobiota bacterium]
MERAKSHNGDFYEPTARFSYRITGMTVAWGPWHKNGFNMVFFDGHVEWWPYSKLAAVNGTWELWSQPPWYSQ